MKNIKWIGISLAATVLLSLASCNTTPPIPDSTQVSSGTGVETKSSGKVTIRHYGPGLIKFHVIDWELYTAIIDYILSKGGEPSPGNIDAVYDAMGH